MGYIDAPVAHQPGGGEGGKVGGDTPPSGGRLLYWGELQGEG